MSDSLIGGYWKTGTDALNKAERLSQGYGLPGDPYAELTSRQVRQLVRSHLELMIVLFWVRKYVPIKAHMYRYLDRVLERAEAARR